MNLDDTIVAPITSSHSKKRFACRLSGPKTKTIGEQWLGRVFSMKYQSSYEQIDLGFEQSIEMLSLTMPEGCSYTKEDVWELHFEANNTVMARLLEKFYNEGVRPAEPGEFTRRAFLNGRIDLEQAQAIAALVKAKNQEHRNQALKMMSGYKGDLLRDLRHKLVSMRAHLEAVIDFPEEPDAFESRELWRKEWSDLKSKMSLCQQQVATQMNQETHLRVLVIGAANAGKSSLLKVLVPSAQPIISTQAGTTLDLVPYSMQIDEDTVLLYDSPGLKREDGLLDQLSLAQLKEKATSFDAYIFLEQLEDDFGKELNLLDHNLKMKLLAKSDLFEKERCQRIRWSALTLEGEKEVMTQLKSWAIRHKKEEQSPWWSLRMQILKRGEETLLALHQLLCEDDTQEELAAYEIDEWLDMWDGVLAEEKDSDQLLDLVFREFCIGK